MSEDIALILKKIQKDGFNTTETRDDVTLNENTLRRFHLNECVKYIYKIKGRSTGIRFDADVESLPRLRQCVDRALEQFIPPKSPIERVKRKLFREARNNRKPSRPKRCQAKKSTYIFKRKSRSSSHKVQRNYLNMARANVIQNMQVEGYKFHQIQQFFYYKAQELLKDMERVAYAHRVFSLSEETCGCHLANIQEETICSNIWHLSSAQL